MVYASTETDVLSVAAERDWHRPPIRLVASPVMWKGTPYAHIMVPTTSMAKSAPKAPVAEKK